MAKKGKTQINVRSLPYRLSWSLLFWPAFILSLYLGLAYYLKLTRPLSAYPPHFQELIDYRPPRPPSPLTSSLPSLQSDSWLLLDIKSGQTVISQNPDTRIYPASLTKLATALTALNIYPWSEPVTINREYREGKVINLTAGERITVGALIQAVIIHSANDAAVALADAHYEGYSGFIKSVNSFLARNGLSSTHFVNVDGVHHPSHYSTAIDLARLGRLAAAQQTITIAAQQTSTVVTDITGTIVHPLASTNELLGQVPEIEGLKTGWTPEAGGCFIGLINHNGHRLISVVVNSPDRFGDTRLLVDWVKTNLYWE